MVCFSPFFWWGKDSFDWHSKMVQGVSSLSTLTTCGKIRFYGSYTTPFKPSKKSHITLEYSQSGKNLFFMKCHRISRLSGFRVEAGWLFGRGEQGLDASAESSEIANDDILIFFFQLSLTTRVQVWI